MSIAKPLVRIVWVDRQQKDSTSWTSNMNEFWLHVTYAVGQNIQKNCKVEEGVRDVVVFAPWLRAGQFETVRWTINEGKDMHMGKYKKKKKRSDIS